MPKQSRGWVYKFTVAAFVAWILVWLASTVLVLDEELGILGAFGLYPITVDALKNPFLFWTIFASGLVFSVWWAIHIYRRKYGDLSKK